MSSAAGPLASLRELLARRDAPPARAALSGSPSDASVALLEGVDMRGLHHCLHVHERMGFIQTYSPPYTALGLLPPFPLASTYPPPSTSPSGSRPTTCSSARSS